MFQALSKLIKDKDKRHSNPKDSPKSNFATKQHPKKNDEKFISPEYFVLLLSKYHHIDTA
jgi:hypothetical protein